MTFRWSPRGAPGDARIGNPELRIVPAITIDRLVIAITSSETKCWHAAHVQSAGAFRQRKGGTELRHASGANRGRCDMSKNSLATITSVLSCGSVAAMLALSSPALAHAAGIITANAANTISRTNAVIPATGYGITAATMSATSKVITVRNIRKTLNTCRAPSARHYLPTPRRRRANLSSY